MKYKKYAIASALSVSLYFLGLFLFFPLAISTSGFVSNSAINIHQTIYQPLLMSVNPNGFLKSNFDQWTKYWCAKYPNRCEDEPPKNT